VELSAASWPPLPARIKNALPLVAAGRFYAIKSSHDQALWVQRLPVGPFLTLLWHHVAGWQHVLMWWSPMRLAVFLAFAVAYFIALAVSFDEATTSEIVRVLVLYEKSTAV
jgi:hypothetical protein